MTVQPQMTFGLKNSSAKEALLSTVVLANNILSSQYRSPAE